MICVRRVLSPSIRVPFSAISLSNPYLSVTRNTISARCGLMKCRPISLQRLQLISPKKYNLMFSMQRKFIQNLSLPGRKLFAGGFFGLSAITAGVMYNKSSITYAMDGPHAEFGEPSGFLKEDLGSLWSLIKKFQLPAVLLITVLLGWRNPITLAINITLLLFCTRPSPFSVHLFVEQLRKKDMRKDPRLHKSKMLYVKKVDVNDYKLLCFAKVELWDVKLDIVGILGSWWVLNTSRA